MPLAKQARQIWAEKLGLVHPLPFSGVIFREIGHLATIHEIYKIKLYCIVIILYRMHKKTPKKTYPSQSSCNSLDAIIVSHVHKTTRPLPQFRAAKPTQQIAIREQIELHPSRNCSYFFLCSREQIRQWKIGFSGRNDKD